MTDTILYYRVNPDKKYTSSECLEDVLDDEENWVEDDDDNDDEFEVTDSECMQQIYAMMSYEKKPITLQDIKKEFEKAVIEAHDKIVNNICVAPDAIYDTAGMHQHIVDNAAYLVALMVERGYLLVV